MENNKKNINIDRCIYRIHMCMYVLALLLLIYLVWNAKEFAFYCDFSLLIFFGFMMLGESIAIADDVEVIHIPQWMRHTYRAVQLFAGFILFLVNDSSYVSAVGAAFIVIFSVELLYYLDFDNMMRRVSIYVALFVSLETISFVFTILQQQRQLEDHFQLIISISIVCLVIVFVGEFIARIWRYYQAKLLRKDRKLERMNEYNEQILEHQERLSKVNELLGLQKVQLQMANHRIHVAHKEMSVQNEVAKVISGSLDLNRMAEALCDLIQEQMSLDFVAIVLEPSIERELISYDENKRFVAYRSVLGSGFDEWIRETFDNGGLERFLELEQTYVENQARTDRFPGKHKQAEKIQSIISVPLMRNNVRIGNLIAIMKTNNAFVHNRGFFETITGQIGTGITNAILYKKTKDMAMRDGLTGIYNRRYLTEILDKWLQQAEVTNKPVSIALFDIDKFKMVNDTFGHMFGDNVITYVAAMLEKKAAENDGVAGRYGGEEFVIVFPGKGIDETFELVRQVHEEIKREELEHEGKTIRVKTSAGIASYPETCKNAKDILTRADWAMYHSKRSGRDQITIDNEKISSIM